jgi:hypothetical protein
MDGIDENRCEELEYNECEENEYRCEDGSCIPEQYWLDGQYDCSDRSDEQPISQDKIDSYFCPLTSSQFNCDEATARDTYFACGDGQFIYDLLRIEGPTCYNYRPDIFFCEFGWQSPDGDTHLTWTLDNGNCVEKGWIEQNLTDMDERKKCVVYLKCILTNGITSGCDNVTHDFQSLCQNETINYPSGPVFNPYVQTVYNLSELKQSSIPSYALYNGSIRCIGYQARSRQQIWPFGNHLFNGDAQFDTFFCNNSETKETSGPQFDKNCWNDTKQSFLCHNSLKCISKHRLRNGIPDCSLGEDEDKKQTCYMKRHRFICPGKSSLCLVVEKIGDDDPVCNRGDDEYITQLKWVLSGRKCRVPGSIECNLIKTYIQSPTSILTTESSKVLVFRQYCDTVWHLSMGFDESFCREWQCSRNEYQCLSGHCVARSYIDGIASTDWHCPDASDGIGLFGIFELSQHNSRLLGPFWFDNIKLELRTNNIFPDPRSFLSMCSYPEEYGCILANVSAPLNFSINRPCINVTQIGDGIIDCYGGLDERNLLTCGNNTFEQRGFDFHCNDQQCIPYHRHCEDRCSNNADSLLCDQLKTLWKPSCEFPSRENLCTSWVYPQCDSTPTDPYYCDAPRRSK